MALSKYIYKIGRRKRSSATVRLFQESGESMINNKSWSEYFPHDADQFQLLTPFRVLELNPKKFHFTVKTRGGGTTGQLDAIKLGLSRALAELNADYRKPLKSHGLLTRDARKVERKKTGLRKARKREQYSKR